MTQVKVLSKKEAGLMGVKLQKEGNTLTLIAMLLVQRYGYGGLAGKRPYSQSHMHKLMRETKEKIATGELTLESVEDIRPPQVTPKESQQDTPGEISLKTRIKQQVARIKEAQTKANRTYLDVSPTRENARATLREINEVLSSPRFGDHLKVKLALALSDLED